MDETKLTGALPNLNVEITHRVSDDGRAEHMVIHLTATPDFRSALPLAGALGQNFPMAMMNAWAEAILAPWAALAQLNPFLALPSTRPVEKD